MEFDNYKKYKWFFTLSGKLVVGGKSAEQNDELLNRIKSTKEDLIVMHTAEPGSPFSVIMADVKKVSKKDLEECAIFTGCFSRAWRAGKKRVEIHIFKSPQISKSTGMKAGTWGVLGKVEKMNIKLELALTQQKDILRAVPELTAKESKKRILGLVPGKINKEKLNDEIKARFGFSLPKEELLSALPSGGFRII